MIPTGHPFRWTLATVLVAVCVLAAACSRPQPDPLAPLAGLARSAMTETEQRVARAHRFLAEEVLPQPRVAGLYTGEIPDDVPGLSWGTTPYIAVGAVDAAGALIEALPSAGDGVRRLLREAARGPEVGDLILIPNTFAFTLGMRQPVPGHEGAALSALLDVDRVIAQGVLQPVAEAAGGFAFLADGNRNVVLSTLPALTGRAISHWSIPVPEPGRDATATVEIDGKRYDVGTATSAGTHAWLIGVGVSAGRTAAGTAPPT